MDPNHRSQTPNPPSGVIGSHGTAPSTPQHTINQALSDGSPVFGLDFFPLSPPDCMGIAMKSRFIAFDGEDMVFRIPTETMYDSHQLAVAHFDLQRFLRPVTQRVEHLLKQREAENALSDAMRRSGLAGHQAPPREILAYQSLPSSPTRRDNDRTTDSPRIGSTLSSVLGPLEDTQSSASGDGCPIPAPVITSPHRTRRVFEGCNLDITVRCTGCAGLLEHTPRFDGTTGETDDALGQHSG